jgi:prolyl-tRNA synthetase
MRMSELFVQTLRDAPTEGGTPGHQLLLRAGLLRPLGLGSFGFTPLGAQTRHKVKALARQKMQVLGGQELDLPHIQSAELFFNEIDLEKIAGLPAGSSTRFRDRSQREVVLSSSQEVGILIMVKGVVQSYRQLPLMLYQIWEPFRDESRTWGGLFGARETLMVDGYSLHADGAALEDFYPHVHEAFVEVFERCQLDVLSVTVNTDGVAPIIHKLVWPSKSGGEMVILCDACGYTVDQTIARAGKTPLPEEDMLPMQDVETPDCKTIAELARFLNVPESRTAKALFLVAYIEGEGDCFVFAIVRGDTELNEAKLKRVLNAETIGPATEAEIRNIGAEPGYGSPVGLEDVTVVVDDLVPESRNLVAGANRPGYHTLNVNYGRDYQASFVADITLAQAGDPCPECSAPLRIEMGVEVASTLKMGDRLSRAMDATYLDQEGKAQPIVMGRYRLYADRLLAAVAEAHHDERGIIWPVAIAPYHVYLMTVGKRSETVDSAATRLYADLAAAGIDVLYDDRDERAGVKFNDADLLGMPLRVVVGERGLENGTLELKRRRQGEVEAIAVEDLVQEVLDQFSGYESQTPRVLK